MLNWFLTKVYKGEQTTIQLRPLHAQNRWTSIRVHCMLAHWGVGKQQNRSISSWPLTSKNTRSWRKESWQGILIGSFETASTTKSSHVCLSSTVATYSSRFQFVLLISFVFVALRDLAFPWRPGEGVNTWRRCRERQRPVVKVESYQQALRRTQSHGIQYSPLPRFKVSKLRIKHGRFILVIQKKQTEQTDADSMRLIAFKVTFPFSPTVHCAKDSLLLCIVKSNWCPNCKWNVWQWLPTVGQCRSIFIFYCSTM